MKNDNQNNSHHLLRGIKNFFSVDPLWKLVSVIVAIIMWLFVMNTINPIESKNFVATISLENMDALTDKGYIVSNLEELENYSVTIKIEGTRPALDELSKSENKNNIKAKIDLSKIEIGEGDTLPKVSQVAIVPSLPSGLFVYNYDIASYYPTVCQIEVDKSASKTLPLELSTYGEVSPECVVENISSEIDEVEVVGPESRIADVERVVANIDITGTKESFNKSCTAVVYDVNNLPLEGFIVNPEEISVEVDVRKKGTVKIEEPVVLGSLPDYLELVSMDWSPKSIEVSSVGEMAVDSIIIPPINLTEITKDTTRSVDISDSLKKAGLEAISGNRQVTVSIKVGLKSAVKYTIPKEQIRILGLEENLEAEISGDASVEIGGMDNVDISTLAPRIDLSGLGVGEHSVEVMLNLPSGAVTNGKATLKVNIIEKSGSVVSTTTTETTTIINDETTTVDETTGEETSEN